MTPLYIARILWLDSATLDDGWVQWCEASRAALDAESMCDTICYVVEENPDFLYVTSTISGNDAHYPTCIPKSTILEMSVFPLTLGQAEPVEAP